ncbi:hypothetical protein HMPREF3110_05220 [Staphylococcus sp. HMSC10C03]|nr:hypothetical protein HMPREF3110_05220 [Staphylococcus sp. HMSC10C03]PNZ42886.1 hypothetical protein CD112_09075 [Staphylococcus simulans]SQE72980.1 Uncharacterised protein [Staphylococcus simulans]
MLRFLLLLVVVGLIYVIVKYLYIVVSKFLKHYPYTKDNYIVKNILLVSDTKYSFIDFIIIMTLVYLAFYSNFFKIT